MRGAHIRIVLCVLAVPLLAAPADKNKKMAYAVLPDQKIELKTPPAVVAKQKCDNWAWAAVFEAMLRLQDAGIDQADWINRFDGGELCLPAVLNDWDELTRRLERDYYVLGDGRKLRLETRFTPGAPLVPDDLIVSLRNNHPPMVVWRGHAYLLAGLLYDEQIARNGSRIFVVKELKLMDTFAPPNKPERFVKFVRDTDNFAEIDGVFTVQVLWQ